MADTWLNEYTQILEQRRVDGSYDGNVLTDIKTGVLENLKYTSQWLYLSNLNYSVDAVNAGIIKFRQAAFLQLDGYSYSGDNVAQHLSARSIDIIVDTPLSLFVDLIDMDLVMLKDSATLTAQNIGSTMLSFNNTMECEWLDMLITCSLATGNVIEIDYSADTAEQAKTNWKVMQLMVNSFKQQFSSFMMGVNPQSMRAVISPRMAIEIQHAFATIIGTSQAFAALQASDANAFRLMGLEIIESILLDTRVGNVEGQTPYFKLRGYNNSGVQAVIVHPEASTIPQQFQSVKSTILPKTGFDRIINRWKYGKGILYPNLIGIVRDKNVADGSDSPMVNLVDTIANGVLSGQTAELQAKAGNKVYHRYVGSGVDELITQLVALGIKTADDIKGRFYTYANGRLNANNVIKPVALSSVITTTSLGEIATNDATSILTAAVAVNSGLQVGEVQVSDISATSAKIGAKAGSIKYTGQVSVTFTLPAQTKK